MDYNLFWVLSNGKVKQSGDRIHYFFNTLSFTTNTYPETLGAEGIESFRYLHLKNRMGIKIVYNNFSTYRRLTQNKKICCRDKRRRKKDRILKKG